MSTNYSGRVTLIVVVLAAALAAVLWPSLAHPLKIGLNGDVPLSQKLNLKPGIDISGGTSLLYEIKVPAGQTAPANLAEQMTRALKLRIDPGGLRNLIWRPQNPNKLEIQMPLSGSTEATQFQKQLEDARAKLDATNIRVPEAVAWVEQGEKRPAGDLDHLAAGSPKRKKLLQDLAAAFDMKQRKIEPGMADYDKLLREQNEADAKYPTLLGELNTSNVNSADLERKMTIRDSTARQKALDETVAQAADFPARKAAIEEYIAARKGLTQSGGGLESAADLKRLLQGSGVLEFHILPPQGDPKLTDPRHPAGYSDWAKQLQSSGPRGNPGDRYRWFEVDNPDEFRHNQVPFDGRQWILASVQKEESLDRLSGTQNEDEARQFGTGGSLQEWKLTRAGPHSDQTTGQRVVEFEFDARGGALFGNLTGRNVQKSMAIMLDGRTISAPNINSPITGGTGIISGGGKGGFTPKELEYLVTMLNAGALPATLSEEPISERTVGPQLGEDNLRRGLTACGIGLVIIAIFLIVYYHLSGLVAFAGVTMNLILILGAMAALNATFTLPGIAAVVLTVGSAVDANVLIFERLREEQHRGLAIRMAIRNAYDRAFSAILDSNMTTLITSAFLILFGTEEVKGFGIALIIGILASLFTSLFVTKTIFGILIDRFHIKKLGSLPLSIPKWDKMLKPNIRWSRLIVPFCAFSIIFIVAGGVLFVKYSKAGQMLDIEFASGTAVTFDLVEPATQEQVRDWIEAESHKHQDALPAASVQRVGNDGKTWEVTTPNDKASEVRDAILRAIGDRLNTEQKILFQNVDKPLSEVNVAGLKPGQPSTAPSATPATAPGTPASSPASTAPATQPATLPSGPVTVLPITSENLTDTSLWPGGVVPQEAKRFTGGAAIFLRGLPPKVTPKDITDRLNRQKLQPELLKGAAAKAVSPDFAIVSASPAPGEKGQTAILLASDSSRDVRNNEQAWRADVVEPMWELAKQALNSESKLQQVKNFNPSVAGDTQKDAVVAMLLSLAFIMAYIWVRFGNLKYGTATVVALLHDVLFVIAALGFAHLLHDSFLGPLLQLEPFRINVTIVAGILTIMGYSMLDTIVVFDRIREIRGKYGHVSITVINDAVNQTLSRTLLTAGTTVISVGIMYFMGGPGIHGFTFVLFVGILAGTYSSVAIASPILLIGGQKHEEATAARPAGATAARA